MNIYLCFLVRLHFTIGRYHRCGLLDFRRVSSSPELKSFLLSICIDALESTVDFRFSGFFEEDASITHASVREQNVALSLIFELADIFRQVPRFYAAHDVRS